MKKSVKKKKTTQGEGFKKSKKGSQEMKDRMAKLRAIRLKKGGNIWSDMASGLIHQGIPAVTGVLGGVAGEVLGGPLGGLAAGVSGSEIGKMGQMQLVTLRVTVWEINNLKKYIHHICK